ncbi:response regulator [Melioribacteraceae bacterium 4301-Me]|uniref:response regulator n=1 Tax=Pyranulibacter aquaticus TaxID=3163344 RepID=UPI0035992DF5
MTILIVDGHDVLREKLIQYLELKSYFAKVFDADSVSKAKIIIQKEKIDIVILDIQLPDSSGLDLVKFCQKWFYKPVIILCSNYALPQYINVYDKFSVDYFFNKFSQLVELKNLIKQLARNEIIDKGLSEKLKSN